MEPNHVTIHSKLKEFFGLQITMKSWNEFVEFLSNNTNSETLGIDIVFFDGVFLIKPPFEFWQYEDSEEILDEDPDYILFLNKINKFF